MPGCALPTGASSRLANVAGGPQFTHIAGYHAGVLVRRLLFRMGWAKVDYRALPWVTYTEPELAPGPA